MRDSFNDLFVDQLSDPVTKRITVYLVWSFCNYDLLAATWFCIHMQFPTQYHPSSSKVHGSLHTFHSVDRSTSWKIRSFYKMHQFFSGDLAIIDVSNTTIDHFSQVVRHNVSCHSYC